MKSAGRHTVEHFLGIELSGAKNPKTTVVALEYYPKERKVFVLEIYEKIAATEESESLPYGIDSPLVHLIQELSTSGAHVGINTPLQLPPCLSCTRKHCPCPEKSPHPSVQWMREYTRKLSLRQDLSHRIKDFTAYTQRPVELWIKNTLLSSLPETHRFEVDEALGGNRAPITARLQFLQRQWKGVRLLETWPKLTVACLSSKLELSRRTISSYRKLEEGAHSREEILEKISQTFGIFVYEKDLRKLARNLSAFDALICALTAWLCALEDCANPPKGFPVRSGWITYPKFPGMPEEKRAQRKVENKEEKKASRTRTSRMSKPRAQERD